MPWLQRELVCFQPAAYQIQLSMRRLGNQVILQKNQIDRLPVQEFHFRSSHITDQFNLGVAAVEMTEVTTKIRIT